MKNEKVEKKEKVKKESKKSKKPKTDVIKKEQEEIVELFQHSNVSAIQETEIKRLLLTIVGDMYDSGSYGDFINPNDI